MTLSIKSWLHERFQFCLHSDVINFFDKISRWRHVVKIAHVATRYQYIAAHTFCASRDTRVSYGWCLQTMRRKQNLASAHVLGIWKEN